MGVSPIFTSPARLNQMLLHASECSNFTTGSFASSDTDADQIPCTNADNCPDGQDS
ncbi:hypothetical protein MAALD49_22670 [Marinobacter shengliensis]|jgi:hypothetical protein|nr:hypothetical protein MAALD49_22670 [Marinobacter shengliensis]